MRVLAAFVAVALVGLAIGAHSAAAGSKKPGGSISADLGPVSVKVDASSGSADASVTASTPAGSVEATVDSSAQTPVSADVDTSTPVAGATVDVGDSPAATVSVPARVDLHEGVKAAVKVRSPAVAGKTAVSAKPIRIVTDTPAGSSGAAVHASAGASNERSATVSVPAAAAAGPATPDDVAHRAAPRTHVVTRRPGHVPRVAAAPRRHAVAAHAGSTRQLVPTANPEPPRPAAGHAPEAARSASVTASSPRAPAAAPAAGGGGGASGSGLSAAGFFAILTAFLMLAAPIVGRWLRPSIGPALRPAFASLPERPG